MGLAGVAYMSSRGSLEVLSEWNAEDSQKMPRDERDFIRWHS